MPERPPIHRKRRTREHVIADLSANYVERQALLCGYSVERVQHDYGVDLLLFTYDEGGEIENAFVSLQLKATDSVHTLANQERIAFPVAHADLDHWLKEVYPCILIVYDAQVDEAYWLYVQAYFSQITDFSLDRVGESITVHLEKRQRVTSDAVRQFSGFKADIVRQVEKARLAYGDQDSDISPA